MAGNTLVDQSRLQILFGSYGVGKAQCMADPFVPLKAQEYRRNLGARMQALDHASVSTKLPACDCYVSRKVDGECTLLLISNGQCVSVNPGGVVRTGLPFMQEAVELLGKTKHKHMLVAGELYVARTDTAAPRQVLPRWEKKKTTKKAAEAAFRVSHRPDQAQRLENWKLRRAFFLPYFLRSTTRESRVRKPSFLRIGRRSGSK